VRFLNGKNSTPFYIFVFVCVEEILFFSLFSSCWLCLLVVVSGLDIYFVFGKAAKCVICIPNHIVKCAMMGDRRSTIIMCGISLRWHVQEIKDINWILWLTINNLYFKSPAGIIVAPAHIYVIIDFPYRL
jgi:hypothetical protein